MIFCGAAANATPCPLSSDPDNRRTECTGEYGVLIKVKARNNLEYHNISERISRIPGVRGTFSTISLRTVKEDIRPNI